MSNTSTNIIQPKFKDHVQRTSYKASEKLVIINEAKKFGILAVAYWLVYSVAEEELLKWINKLHLIEIVMMADAIKLQM
ncbi:2511_t:CDS:2, partial [Ambispora leptoticha]